MDEQNRTDTGNTSRIKEMHTDLPARMPEGNRCGKGWAKYKAEKSEEDKMINTRSFAISILLAVLLISLGYAQDLSSYRNYRLEMNLAAVAKQADMNASDAQSICRRPALIQELEWQSQNPLSSSPKADPVKRILFDFYNDKLFRILVSYHQERTEGLTDEDLIESISTKYGTPTRPAGTIRVYSPSNIYSQTEKLIARWEDSQYSFNLFRMSYQSTPGMLIFSKKLELLALAAIEESKQLDAQEAPQREIDRQKQQDVDNRTAGQKVRPANKANFRP
jgi:hypothetical protein